MRNSKNLYKIVHFHASDYDLTFNIVYRSNIDHLEMRLVHNTYKSRNVERVYSEFGQRLMLGDLSIIFFTTVDSYKCEIMRLEICDLDEGKMLLDLNIYLSSFGNSAENAHEAHYNSGTIRYEEHEYVMEIGPA